MKKRISLVVLLLAAMITLAACADSSKPKSEKGHADSTQKATTTAAAKDAAKKTEAEKTEAEKTEAEKTEAEKSEAEKSEAEKSEAEKTEAEKTEAEKTEAEEAAADKKGLKEKYVMGLDDTFAPMGFRDDGGALVGFDIDLSKAVAKEIGIEIEYRPVDWTMKESELNTGKIDFIWNGYSITPARQEEVAFSKPYLDNRQIIVVMAESDIQSKEDMAGKTVTVQGESSALDAINKEPELVKSFAEIVEYPSNNECFTDLETGRADVMVVDEVLARYYMNARGEEKYRVLKDNFGEEQFGIGMRKDDAALVEAVDAALDKLIEDGTFDEIRGRWFSDN